MLFKDAAQLECIFLVVPVWLLTFTHVHPVSMCFCFACFLFHPQHFSPTKSWDELHIGLLWLIESLGIHATPVSTAVDNWIFLAMGATTSIVSHLLSWMVFFVRHGLRWSGFGVFGMSPSQLETQRKTQTKNLTNQSWPSPPIQKNQKNLAFKEWMNSLGRWRTFWHHDDPMFRRRTFFSCRVGWLGKPQKVVSLVREIRAP